MKLTFSFSDSDKLVLEKRSGESLRHIVLKVLGCLLYYDRSPRIELRVSEDKRDYRPDVVAFDEPGHITLWVDCGQIAVRKVDDLTRQLPDAEIVILKPTDREMESYAREAAKKVRRIERVQFFGFDATFVPALIGQIGHLNTVRWQRDGAELRVTLNGQEFATTLWRWEAATGLAVPAA